MLAQVAEFIRRKGRVTISALAVESNKLIDLHESKLPPVHHDADTTESHTNEDTTSS
jgi:hypothetical protein